MPTFAKTITITLYYIFYYSPVHLCQGHLYLSVDVISQSPDEANIVTASFQMKGTKGLYLPSPQYLFELAKASSLLYPLGGDLRTKIYP